MRRVRLQRIPSRCSPPVLIVCEQSSLCTCALPSSPGCEACAGGLVLSGLRWRVAGLELGMPGRHCDLCHRDTGTSSYFTLD